MNLYPYPDVMVVADPVALKPERKDTVMSAVLIAEVLSSSTEAYDRKEKFEHYRTMQSFTEYVLIDQYRPHVEHYERQAPNQWLFAEYSGLDGSFTLSSVGVEITIADLYEAVEFE
ncbi:MAG: Uma2 family endonuclease [Phormidesmis sp.]